MSSPPTVQWLLQARMREAGIFSNEDLKRQLASLGVPLSSSQVHRLVTETPERLNLTVLAALCQLLRVDPDDLIQVVDARRHQTAVGDNVVDLAREGRPRRARVTPSDGD